MSGEKFSVKEQRFIDVYDGNATEAARQAGYKNPERSGAQNVRKRKIWDAIWNREKTRKNNNIATRERRQEFWTETMLDENEAMANRLNASKLLGQSEGDFIEKREHTGKNGGPIETEQKVVIEFVDADENPDTQKT